MPNSRCSVTMSGFNRHATVSMPSTACMMSVAKSVNTSGTLTRRCPRLPTASAVTSTMIRASVPTA